MLSVLSSSYKELGKLCSSFLRLTLSGLTSKQKIMPRLLLEPLDDMHKIVVQAECTIQVARCKRIKNTKSCSLDWTIYTNIVIIMQQIMSLPRENEKTEP